MSISVLRSALLSLLLLVGTTGSIASNRSSWPHLSRATEPLSAEHVFTLTPVQACRRACLEASRVLSLDSGRQGRCTARHLRHH